MLRAWAGPEATGGDLAWKRKRRVVVEEEEDDGWKCDEEEKEEILEQESTESRESGCRRRARRRGLFTSDLRGQGEVNTGPLSAREGQEMSSFFLLFFIYSTQLYMKIAN